MGSINWTGRSALGVLALFSEGTAMARENADAMERFSIDAPAEDPRQDQVRDTISGGGQLRSNAKSAMLDWGTGGFELCGERLEWGSGSADVARTGRQWRRTYAADVSFWKDAAPGISFEAGARLERTSSGVAGGPLLSTSTKSVAHIAYVGAQMRDSSSVRLLAFGNSGWSGDAAGEP